MSSAACSIPGQFVYCICPHDKVINSLGTSIPSCASPPSVPCAAVGMEGFWGVLLSCAALPVLCYIRGPDGLPLDSLVEAVQVGKCRCDPCLKPLVRQAWSCCESAACMHSVRLSAHGSRMSFFRLKRPRSQCPCPACFAANRGQLDAPVDHPGHGALNRAV